MHRDIKPENILLTAAADGTLIHKLCDFGIAVAASSGAAGASAAIASTLQTGTVGIQAQVGGRGRVCHQVQISTGRAHRHMRSQLVLRTLRWMSALNDRPALGYSRRRTSSTMSVLISIQPLVELYGDCMVVLKVS